MTARIKLFYAAERDPSGRKNYWMPCVINDTFGDKTLEEQNAILKATKWADLLTNAEWPVMLQNVRNPPVRSRLKKKIVHWLMIMGRIAALNPELLVQALREADALYLEQTGAPHPFVSVRPQGLPWTGMSWAVLDEKDEP
jgi:hypothetical protein